VIAVLNLASRSVDRIPDAARTALEAIATQLGSVLPRIAAETEVREQQARLRALFDATPDIAALLDRSGRLVALNEACSRSLGLDRTAAIGLDVFRLLDSAASRRRRAMMRAVLTQGRPVAFSDQRDGRWFDNRMFPVRDDQGRVTGAAVFARDVTEIRGLEQQIVRVSEFEKQRIGRDLHDNLMQQLAGVSFLSAALARRLSGSDPACAQEAVGNAVRHGRPSRVDVTLGIRGSRCTLRVTDDGAGIAAAPPGSGLGVKIMRYRANLLGGQLTITPGRRSGTVVACRFEVPAPA
jgi:PAS domain S-box-containing protein